MRRILNNSISLLVVIIVLFLVVPLPKQALDILIVLNIAISIMILMITMSISEALEFSIFPSLLLITTLFRLGLNVSSTRLILSEGGDAGMVIKSFGTLITQGNIVIGILIFLIIVLVQFIVIDPCEVLLPVCPERQRVPGGCPGTEGPGGGGVLRGAGHRHL